MFTGLMMVMVMLFSLGFTGLMGFAAFTYIRRTWQVIRSEEIGSIQFRMLDELDQIRTQNHMISDRLDRLEKMLTSGQEPALPESESSTLLPGKSADDARSL